MKQVVQSLNGGKLSLAAAPQPLARPGTVVIANAFSLISAGTEKTAMELAQKSLLGKARERPDHVRRVLEKIRNEGLFNTVAQVRARLDEPMTMGYSSSGTVLAVGAGVEEFKSGNRVASNGPHAEVVCVPRRLCARVPEGVALDHAAFTVLGAIALQGIRLANLEIGSTALVVGLGLIGQITVALLRSSGVRAIGTDPDLSRCELARRMGAVEANPGLSASAVEAITGGLGADAVILTASTSSNGPVDLAAGAVRKKGRIVLVGVVGLELDRRPFYFKECEFVVSCSYGPGRYDADYEDRGHDYPPAYVRWTEQRNMQAVLDLMGSGRLDLSPLVSHRFPIDRALEAYELIEDGKSSYLGVLLEYPGARINEPVRAESAPPRKRDPDGRIGIGVLGAGNFARMVMLPAISNGEDFAPRVLCSATGLSAASAGPRFGFATATSQQEEVFRDEQVEAVFVLTRHAEHARQVAGGLKAARHVFVEKPLAVTEDQLIELEGVLQELSPNLPVLTVGFNRRFSPAALRMRELFNRVRAPLTVSIRFNAGAIPASHWTQDETAGGGRIIGEACHAIDLATFITGSPPVRVFAESIGGLNAPPVSDDQCFITLRHANGSVSSIGYLAGGDKAFPKERVEVFGGGVVGVIDDFREIVTCSNGRTRRTRLGAQDKGHKAEVRAFADGIRSGIWPIPWRELHAVTLASILTVRSLREGQPFDIPAPATLIEHHGVRR